MRREIMTRTTKAYAAEIYICIVWGTTYLAIKLGVAHYPPFLFAGVRQTIAGVLLMITALILNKQKDLSLRNISQQMLIGFLMLTVGNGCVTVGLKHISSGVSALICSMMPIFAVLFNLMSSQRDKFNMTIGAGLLLGACGVGLIFRNNIEDLAKPAFIGGIALTLLATCSWALGSMKNKKNGNKINPFFNSGLQLLFGGVFMLIISPFADNYANLQLWNTEGMLSLIYLIIFGSVIAYAAYMYALNVLPVGLATIYAYINPLIAVVAGYLFLKEGLNLFTMLAFITIAVSVYLVNKGYRKQHAEIKSGNGFPETIPTES
jgi:drug/metabolite transporter (DMT)-like permease